MSKSGHFTVDAEGRVYENGVLTGVTSIPRLNDKEEAELQKIIDEYLNKLKSER